MRALLGTAECCWAACAPQTDFPELKKAIDCDIVVVGAGIVGLTTAFAWPSTVSPWLW